VLLDFSSVAIVLLLKENKSIDIKMAEINRVPDQNIRMKVSLIELQNYENENDNSMIFVGKS
jgi:hypothetical protein